MKAVLELETGSPRVSDALDFAFSLNFVILLISILAAIAATTLISHFLNINIKVR